MNKIKNWVEDRQSCFILYTVNEISGRKMASRAKLNAASHIERLPKWIEHFKNLFGNPPEITDKRA